MTDEPTGVRRRGLRAGLRGWGGVAGMAAACALTAAVTLLPLSHGGADVLDAEPARHGSSLPAKADDCTDPEASLRPSAGGGPNIDAIKERGKLVVGVDQNSYQWGFRRPLDPEETADGTAKASAGRLEGFDIDLARAIAADILGSEDAIIFRAIPTNQRIAALDSGAVDIVVRTMTINCARIEQVAFSTAYFQAGQQVLAPKGQEITGYDASLKGRRVCTAEGSTAYEAMERNAFGATFRDEHDGGPQDEDLLTVPNQLDCLVRLQQGLVDAIVTDNALAAGQAAQDPSVELKGEPFTTEFYGVATKLGKDDVVRRVNHVLDEYRKGPWMAAYTRWLKDDLPGITAPPRPEYRD
ncbi:glutamate ABC transporter substrate-binding protein [Streptomyces genisteinicus]|uniref:Glutamate ABC transporter substrate-binding protein n=1 Tax=Streptomyces genisteinicus TaxID=2768068 RepID=A0A7H0HS25_9ACTN|nr:glutamate ABC transporter substrate-binding protein [Streptomyces genisteinicus]QNP63341.1 glutamate ABC transporter substrate-binding protein [Streptomyces genisteinicus]